MVTMVSAHPKYFHRVESPRTRYCFGHRSAQEWTKSADPWCQFITTWKSLKVIAAAHLACTPLFSYMSSMSPPDVAVREQLHTSLLNTLSSHVLSSSQRTQQPTLIVAIKPRRMRGASAWHESYLLSCHADPLSRAFLNHSSPNLRCVWR